MSKYRWAFPITLLLAIVSIGCAHSVKERWRSEAAVLNVESFIYSVDGKERLTFKGNGSGVFLNREGDLLTSAHLVRRACKLEAKTEDNKIYNADNLRYVDLFKDFAILKMDGYPSDIREIKFEPKENIKKDEEVIIVGNMLGLNSLSVTRGRIVNIKSDPINKSDLLIIDGIANPGSSGGPIYSKDYNLVGIVMGILDTPGGKLTAGIPAYEIKKALSNENKVDMNLCKFYTSEDNANKRYLKLESHSLCLFKGSQFPISVYTMETVDYVLKVSVKSGSVGIIINDNGRILDKKFSSDKPAEFKIVRLSKDVVMLNLYNEYSNSACVDIEFGVINW
jgi:hypothetical protein